MATTSLDKQCGAQRANQPPGTLCTRPAGWGTDHPGIGRCKRHGGCTPNHQRAAEVEIARQECVKLAIPVEIHPAEALVREVFRAQGWVHYLSGLVDDLRGGEGGIYGRTYHVSGIETGEAKPHVAYVMLMEERKQLVAVSSAALKAGVDERRLQMVQGEGQRLATFGRRLLEEHGIDPSAEKARAIFRKLLTEMGDLS